MISARRAALLGLTVPLSPIMIAVLGLWPEPEDEPIALLPQVYGSGRRLAVPADPLQNDKIRPRRAQQPIDDAREVREAWDAIDATVAMRKQREARKLEDAQARRGELEVRPIEVDARLAADSLAAAAAEQAAEPAAMDAAGSAARAAVNAAMRRRQNDDDAALVVLLAATD